MVPVECVVRNRAAGSLVKRLGIEEGIELNPPLFDLFLKTTPCTIRWSTESYCETFGWVSKELARMKELTYKANDVLKKLFDDAGLILVDFKLEFGLYKGEVVLGDEFSPDGSRLWDKELEKMDKDRFRQSLGGLIEAYEAVARRRVYSWTDFSIHHLAVLLARQTTSSHKMSIERSFLRHFIPLSCGNLPLNHLRSFL